MGACTYLPWAQPQVVQTSVAAPVGAHSSVRWLQLQLQLQDGRMMVDYACIGIGCVIGELADLMTIESNSNVAHLISLALHELSPKRIHTGCTQHCDALQPHSCVHTTVVQQYSITTFCLLLPINLLTMAYSQEYDGSERGAHTWLREQVHNSLIGRIGLGRMSRRQLSIERGWVTHTSGTTSRTTFTTCGNSCKRIST